MVGILIKRGGAKDSLESVANAVSITIKGGFCVAVPCNGTVSVAFGSSVVAKYDVASVAGTSYGQTDVALELYAVVVVKRNGLSSRA